MNAKAMCGSSADSHIAFLRCTHLKSRFQQSHIIEKHTLIIYPNTILVILFYKA